MILQVNWIISKRKRSDQVDGEDDLSHDAATNGNKFGSLANRSHEALDIRALFNQAKLIYYIFGIWWTNANNCFIHAIFITQVNATYWSDCVPTAINSNVGFDYSSYKSFMKMKWRLSAMSFYILSLIKSMHNTQSWNFFWSGPIYREARIM